MEALRVAIDELVSAGIRSYIDLLGYGERTRSRRLFSDALQLSAMISGGPSARISPLLVAESINPSLEMTAECSCTRPEKMLNRPMTTCLILLALRSILATLLVLKATTYWRRIPALEELQASCIKVAEFMVSPVVETEPVVKTHTSGRTQPSGTTQPSERTSGELNFSASDPALNCGKSHETGTTCGCRRNNALPTVPELAERSVPSI